MSSQELPFMTITQRRAGMYNDMYLYERPDLMERFERITESVSGPWAPLAQFVAAAVIGKEELSDEQMAERAYRLAAADHYLQANPETVVAGVSKNRFIAGRTREESVLMIHEQPKFDAERVTLGIPTTTSLEITRPPGYVYDIDARVNASGGIRLPMPESIILPQNRADAWYIADHAEGQGILAIGRSAVETVFQSLSCDTFEPINPDLALAVQIARPLLGMA